MSKRLRTAVVALVGVAALAACGASGSDTGGVSGRPSDEPVDHPTTVAPSSDGSTGASNDIPDDTASTTAAAPTITRPDWLGTRVLPAGPSGAAAPQPTPPELDPRILPTVDLLPPPADGAFTATVDPVPDDVLARSTWDPDCPVAVDDLRYVTVSFWGFDDRPHTGELLVHRDVADDAAAAFEALYDARFPVEEMRVVDAPELDLPPTGDGNNTTSFVCRPARGATTWSEHAYGRAIDVNPFMNPYEKGDVVLPELATSYLDRSNVRPGMLTADGPAVAAFAAQGWEWGGEWSSLKDWMHFSPSGR